MPHAFNQLPANIPWQELFNQAKISFDQAYAPYSNFQVGCASITQAGDIHHGCNVENASYGLTVCAERNCIANAVIKGDQQFSAFVIYTEQEKLTPPCGACRQVIAEFCAPETPIVACNHEHQYKLWTLGQLLPDAFTPKDLL